MASYTTVLTFGKYLGGAPAGATVAADVAAVKASVGTPAQASVLGAAVGASISADVAAVKASVGTPMQAASYAAPPAVSAIADAIWDEATSGHVTVGTFGKLDADISTDVAAVHVHAGTIETDVAAVHVHVGTIDGHITADYGATEKSAIDLLDDAAGGLVDIHTDVAAVKAETALIVADTNELQVELADGGRTDLILDGIASDTDTIIAALPTVSYRFLIRC